MCDCAQKLQSCAHKLSDCGGGGGGGGVSLQVATPGTPDTGNFNVSGTGIVGESLYAAGNLIAASGGGVGGFEGTYLTLVGASANPVVTIQAEDGGPGVNPTVRIDASNDGNQTSPLLVLNGNNGVARFNADAEIAIDALGVNVLQFHGNGAKLGLGNLSGAPDTMLHLFGGNTFTGSAAIIVQNDSRTDLSNVSKLCFADTNTALTLSNACIVFQTVAGAAGDLVGYVAGTDNDTPGTEIWRAASTGSGIAPGGDPIFYVNFPGLGGSQGAYPFQVGGAAYFDGQIKANSGIDVNSSAIVGLFGLDVGGGALTNAISVAGISNNGIKSLTGKDLLLGTADGGLTFSILADGSGIRALGNAALDGQVAIGNNGTIGSHQLDVTGTAAFTGIVNFDANIATIRGQALVWPAANAAGVLTNDGAGNLSWV